MISPILNILRSLKPAPLLYVAIDNNNNQPETIVLLHGIAASSTAWQPVVDRLDQEKYRIITLDLLGHGLSPKPTNCLYSADDHVKSIRRTLKRLNIPTPIQLVGHSMGAIIALRYYQSHPRKITALHLLSPPLYSKREISSRRSITKLKTDMYLEFYRLLSTKKGFTLNASRNIRKILRIKEAALVTEDTWQAFRMSLTNTIVHQFAYEDIRNTDIPIHITYGAADEFLIPKNIDSLKKQKNVQIAKLSGIRHIIGVRFAKKVIEQIESTSE